MSVIWLGNGTLYIAFKPDLLPVSAEDLDLWLRRYHVLSGALASWADGHSEQELRAEPADGRSAHDMFLHALSSTGAYLSTVLAGTDAVQRCDDTVRPR